MNKIDNLKINIFNAAGQGNLGDDAMLQVFIEKLSKYGLVELVSSSARIRKELKNKFNLPTRLHPGDKEKTIVIIGGGTLFDKGVRDPTDPYLKIADNLLNQGYRVYFSHVGVISFFDSKLARRVFLRSSGITVRNRESAQIIINVTGRKRKPEIVGDPAEEYKIPQKKLAKKKIVGIDFSPKELISDENIGKLVTKINSLGYKSEWFSFSNHYLADHEDDLLLGKRIKNEQVQDLIINPETNLDNLLIEMTKYKLIITSRLHVLLFAKRRKINVINVTKAEKNIRYARQFKLPTLEVEELINKIDKNKLSFL